MRQTLRSVAAAALVIAGTISVTPAMAQQPVAASSNAFKRTADGKPDFSGAWTRGGVMGVPGAGITAVKTDKGICVVNCGPPPGAAPAGATPAARPKPDFPAYKPEFKDKVTQLSKEQVKYDASLRCQNPGLPRIGPPKKITQTANEIIFLYEDITGGYWRIIPTDGRAHRDDVEESYLGDSVGHWEGDKLVIETVSFNDDFWLTDNGAFHTRDMKVIEELAPSGADISYTAVVHDPAVLVEPWSKTAIIKAMKDPYEPVPCVEMSIEKMTGTESYHANPRW